MTIPFSAVEGCFNFVARSSRMLSEDLETATCRHNFAPLFLRPMLLTAKEGSLEGVLQVNKLV